MPTIERDIVMQSKDENGNPTIDLPITRLGNVEDSAEIKEELSAGDYLPIIDSEDNGQMKKVKVGNISLPANGGNADTVDGAHVVTTSALGLHLMASGTDEPTSENCPPGAWYGQYE